MSAEVRLQQGYRLIRQVAGDGDSPWAGSLVALPSGETAVAVDAGVLGDAWGGWDAAASGHVMSAIDILRRPDGHDVLLPVCTERVSDFLARRSARGTELSAGEAVTLAVSLLRGIGEVVPRDESVCGTWWLTDAGRPVLATGSGTGAALGDTADLLARIARDVPTIAAALSDAVGALGAPDDPRRRMRELDRAEARLFEVAEPLALATTSFGSQRVREALPIDGEVSLRAEQPRGSWALSLARHVDADWADVVSRTTTGVWRAVRNRRPARRRPWVVAGGLAVALVVGGLLWPRSGDGPATADVITPLATADAAPPEQTVEQPVDTSSDTSNDTSVDTPVDLVTVAGALLEARTACGAEPACLADVLESADARFPSGVVDLPSQERSVTLLDEFGGAAVLRADAAGSDATPQLIVIVRLDGRWLVRDVYEVADQ